MGGPEKIRITSRAGINEEVVGIVANNPIVNMGPMDTDAMEKMISFLCLCDSYNIPLIFLHDPPGHMVGKEAERKKVGAKIVNALQALFQVTVPKIAIIIPKSFGRAAVNMCGMGGGLDFFVAWPTAEIGFMDLLIATDVVFDSLSENDKTNEVKK